MKKQFCTKILANASHIFHLLSPTHAYFKKLNYFILFIEFFFFFFFFVFFSFYNIFFYTQSAFVFHLADFCNVHNYIIAFFLLFFRNILISFTSFSCSFSLLPWWVFRHFQICEKRIIRKLIKKFELLENLKCCKSFMHF